MTKALSPELNTNLIMSKRGISTLLKLTLMTGILLFHESWAHIYKDDYEKLFYDKATDAFHKSLDFEKVRMTAFLMSRQVSIYLIFMCVVAKNVGNFWLPLNDHHVVF